MKKSFASAAAVLAGAALGGATKRLFAVRKYEAGDLAMRRLTAYCIIPVWIGAGFLDYIWHRRTKIETTSGLEESLIHSLMMIESSPPVLAPLFLKIDSGVLAGMVGFSVVHELTVLWDLWFTAPRRKIPAGEQITHTFLEAAPFLTTAAAIVTHWDEFLALAGRGRRDARFGIRLRRPPLPLRSAIAIFAAIGLFGAIPHADELRRCIEAKREGHEGQDTAACLKEVFA